jgi:peptide/nickel transport system permease protein
MIKMATRQEKLKFRIKQLQGFLSHFKQSKRGMLGIAIIIFFVSLAIFAPLLTPYQPVGQESMWLSGRTAVPAWMKYLPGGDKLSENMDPIVDSYFKEPSSISQWSIERSSAENKVFIQYLAGIGKDWTDLGSIAIAYHRGENETPPGNVNITLTKQFYYPYNGPPYKFDCSVAVLAEIENNLPIKAIVFLKQDFGQNKTLEWGMGDYWAFKFFTSTSTMWATPFPAISSAATDTARFQHFGTSDDLAKIIFTQAGNYSFGVRLTFSDTRANTTVASSVYVDDLNIVLTGTCFGILGTDSQGADILTKLIYGTRISLYVGLLSAIVSIVIGLALGLIAGYIRGTVDEVIMRFTDVLLVLPGLPLLIVLITVLGTSINNLIILIGFLGWMGFARVIRSQVLSLKERPFIEAAKALGGSKSHILVKHLLPNVMGLVYVTLALSVPTAIVSEASLAWLGFFDPSITSWGRMLNDVQTAGAYMAWWWVIPPGIFIAILSLSFILLGYAIDDILNPKLRVRR